MTWQSLLTPLFWLLNGFLAMTYLLAGHWLTLLLVPVLAWLSWRGPAEHRAWSLSISALAVLTSLLAPQPLPTLLLLMACGACLALRLEKFNPANLHWRTISGIALYSLVGAGISAFQFYINRPSTDNVWLVQGQAYFGLLAAVGLYGMPLAYLALLAQGMLVHPPIPGGGNPSELIHSLRARKQD